MIHIDDCMLFSAKKIELHEDIMETKVDHFNSIIKENENENKDGN